MALKFLNKKGWHTGSLRNIENVWKAEQKHEAEERKLEELRKQIQEERQKSEYRQLQEQAGLIPRQERLDFLYESGLAVGKGSSGSTSDVFKALQAPPPPESGSAPAADTGASSSNAVPGALFEDKPQSANDAWRKLHSDPLLVIRQREQEAIKRITSNPIKMAMIRKSAEEEKKAKQEKKHKSRSGRHGKLETRSSNASDKDEVDVSREREREREREKERARRRDLSVEHRDHSILRHRNHHGDSSDSDDARRRHRNDGKQEQRHRTDGELDHKHRYRDEKEMKSHRRGVTHMSEEERVARLRAMQIDGQLHEEQRWKRLKKADDADAKEATTSAGTSYFRGKNFLHDAQKSIYGAEERGDRAATVEESVRRRKYYSQGSTDAHEHNAFRR